MKGLTVATFKITDRSLDGMRSAGVPDEVLQKLAPIKDREVRGKGNFLGLVQQTIGYQQTAMFRRVILKHAAIKPKKSGRRRLKKPSLPQYVGKFIHSAILSAVISLTIFGQDWLNGVLYTESVNPAVNFITWVKVLASALVFVIFLLLKLLYNLGIIQD